MKKVFRSLLLCLLLSLPALAQPGVKIGLVSVQVRGDFQPLDTSATNSILLEALRQEAPQAEFVVLESAEQIVFPNQAEALGKGAGVDMVIWGDVRCREGDVSSRERYYRGRIQLYLTTEADLKVLLVSENRLLVSQPIIVSSNEQTKSWVSGEGQNLSVEQKLASNNLMEVARSLLTVIRKREQRESIPNNV